MPARKRRAASPPAEGEGESRRRSRRISSTPKKSRYFEDGGDDDDDFDGDAKLEDESDEPESEVDEEEEEEQPKKRGRGRPKVQAAKPKAKPQPKATKAKAVKKQKVEEVEDDYQDEQPDEDEEEEEEEDDFEGERRVTVIPLEKLRPLDGVDYLDETVHKNTLLFLKDLKAHNQRSWLKSHDGEYRRALKDWNSFVETITPKVTEVDFTIPELPAKDLVFRIHRDIRFSKDPTPYKAHFSAAWSRTGKKGPYACYYIHLEPGSCFVGGGLWCPEASHLQKLRESIDERPQRWRRVLNDERFKMTFLPKIAKKGGEEGALKAFAETNKGNALKTKPKASSLDEVSKGGTAGYLADHRDIELLKLRNFTISKKIDDRIFTEEDAQDKVCEVIAAMHPFITFLNSVVMPDLNLDEEDDSEDEDENDQENGDAEENGNPEDTGDEEEEEGKDWSTHKF
ncbi:glycoside hydrolase family 92 protein [Colletotrichum tofieldiae]|uniref:Glycoside hydrolase family 92 protein n=1 Tax=Colletotrichum tofieldiae TaxID=708197 RepID=A0A166MZM7_9PEZI|nr:glycoside hydrolase family 92 protein [Colletotrichum tofieldiae]GKT65996.1 glycoside hydrolase family 92 protein [Colletotrichum tofieldiae]